MVSISNQQSAITAQQHSQKSAEHRSAGADGCGLNCQMPMIGTALNWRPELLRAICIACCLWRASRGILTAISLNGLGLQFLV